MQPLIGTPEPLPETGVLANQGPARESSDQSEASKRRHHRRTTTSLYIGSLYIGYVLPLILPLLFKLAKAAYQVVSEWPWHHQAGIHYHLCHHISAYPWGGPMDNK